MKTHRNNMQCKPLTTRDWDYKTLTWFKNTKSSMDLIEC